MNSTEKSRASGIELEKPHLQESAIVRSYRGLFWDRVSLLKWMGNELGEIGSGFFGPRELILVNSPEYVHQVLVEQAEKFHKGSQFRIHTRPLLGNGLLLSEDGIHRRQRKLVAPAFVHKRVGQYADVMVRYAAEAAAGWKDGSEIDIWLEMMRVTLGVTGKTLFGAELTSQTNEIKQAMNYLTRYAERRLRLPWAVPFEWKSPRNIRARKEIARLDAIVFAMIADRRKSGEDVGDLLSMLLIARDEEDGTGMTDQQVRDEAMTIFLAGHETTANATAWMWYLLSQHPAEYNRLIEETDRVLHGCAATIEDLANLPYALQVFKESMRLYPPAYILVREATEDVWLGKYKIPKGGSVILSPYLLHRLPEYFPNPTRFDPDRFKPEHERALPRYAYLPFGAGPRVCIGNQFALMEGQLIAATMAQHVRFESLSSEPLECDPLITLRPKKGMPTRVHARISD